MSSHPYEPVFRRKRIVQNDTPNNEGGTETRDITDEERS